jgi:hypothetical protein
VLGPRVVLAALCAALTLSIAPAGASAANHPAIGFGEQRASVFHNEHWQSLGLKHMRLLVGWDMLRYRWQRREADNWIRAAEAQGARILVAFSRSRSHWRRKKLPTAGEYERQFLRFRERYPGVKNFLAWNEANHCSQPTCHRPDRAAEYFDVLADNCAECTIVAADVLDTRDMVSWLKRFRRHARHTPKVWGLHNYIDANRFRTTGTRAMLATVKGEIWFTETGGLVKRKKTSAIPFPDSPAHAAKATRWVLERLTQLSPRIRRVYLYHFQNQGPKATWDSGILDRKGRPRPAYKVLTKYVARVQRAKRAAQKAAS